MPHLHHHHHHFRWSGFWIRLQTRQHVGGANSVGFSLAVLFAYSCYKKSRTQSWLSMKYLPMTSSSQILISCCSWHHPLSQSCASQRFSFCFLSSPVSVSSFCFCQAYHSALLRLFNATYFELSSSESLEEESFETLLLHNLQSTCKRNTSAIATSFYLISFFLWELDPHLPCGLKSNRSKHQRKLV